MLLNSSAVYICDALQIIAAVVINYFVTHIPSILGTVFFGSSAFFWMRWKYYRFIERFKKHKRSFIAYLLYPTIDSSITIFVECCMLFGLYISIATLFFPFFCMQERVSDVIALTVGACAILFPVIILMLTERNSDKDSSYIIPRVQIWLHYSWALPIAILLLSYLVFLTLPVPHHYLFILTTIVLLATLFLTARLLIIFFVASQAECVENNIIKIQFRQSLITSILDQIKDIKKSKKIIYGSRDSVNVNDLLEELDILSEQDGTVKNVDIKAIQNRIHSKFDKKEYKTDKSFNLPKRDFSNSYYEIEIRAMPGTLIKSSINFVNLKNHEDYNKFVLATIKFQKGLFTRDIQRELISEIQQEFEISIHPIEKQKLDVFCENFTETLRRLKVVGIASIIGREPNYAKRLSDIYYMIINDSYEIIRSIKHAGRQSKTDLASFDNHSENLISVYRFNYQQLIGRIYKNITEWTISAFGEEYSEEVAEHVKALSYNLAHKALTHHDLETFKNIIQLAVSQKRKNSPRFEARGWLNHISQQIFKNFVNTGEKEIFVKAIFDLCIYFGFLSIKNYDISTFVEIDELLENYEGGFLLSQKNEKSLVIENWIKELRINWVGYAVMQIIAPDNDTAITADKVLILKNAIKKAAQGFEAKDVFKVYFELSQDERKYREKWQLGSWWEQHIPEKHGYLFSIKDKKAVVFAYIMSLLQIPVHERWQLNLNLSIELNLELENQNIHSMRALHTSLAYILKKENSIPLEDLIDFELVKLISEHLNKEITAREQSLKKKYAQLDLQPEVIHHIQKDFETTFLSCNDLRKYFQPLEDGSINCDTKGFGVNTLVSRNVFTGEFESRFGKNLGAALARDEQEHIFTLIKRYAKKITQNAIAVSQLIQLAEQQGMQYSEMIIFCLNALMHLDNNFDRESQQFQYQGTNIPVINVFSRSEAVNNQPRNQIILLNKNQVKILYKREGKCLETLGFIFDIIDPRADATLRDHIIKAKPDWLKNEPESDWEELVGQYVQVRVLECIDVKVPEGSALVAELNSAYWH